MGAFTGNCKTRAFDDGGWSQKVSNLVDLYRLLCPMPDGEKYNGTKNAPNEEVSGASHASRRATAAWRPALVAPDRHRRSQCPRRPRRRLSPRRACDLSVPGDNFISLLSHFSELIPTVRISAADNPLKQESASTKLFIEDRVRLNTFSDARPSPPLQEQFRGDLDILPARGEMSICSTPSCFPRKPSESGHSGT